MATSFIHSLLRSLPLVAIGLLLVLIAWASGRFADPQPQAAASASSGWPPLGILLVLSAAGWLLAAGYLATLLRAHGGRGTQVVPDRVREALDTLAEGLLVLDEGERIVLANRAFAETVGASPVQLQGRAASSLPWVCGEGTAPEDLPWIRATAQQKPLTDQMMHYQLADGSRRIFSINSAPILASDGSQRGALATFRDVTQNEEHRAQLETMLAMLKSSRDEISRKNRELEILAAQDALTGCLNRRSFFERFERAWQEAAIRGEPIACIMVDADHFKNVNDTYGHHVGDEVLRQISRILHTLQDDRHLICRMGGEEFCVVTPGLGLEEAVEVAERIRLAITEARFSDPAELRLTASLGVSASGFDAEGPQPLINQADKCLYLAKRKGRNQVVPYDPSLESLTIDETLLSREAPPEERLRGNAEIPFRAVTALLGAIACRDPATAEHSRRVADLCLAAAEGLFDPHERYLLEVAALLHDLGKIGIPDHVLRKPGPLDAEEWELMSHRHRLAVEIVAGTFDSPPLAEIIQLHSVPYQGRVNDHTSPWGEQLPLAARLLNIADGYDSMTNEQAYREARSHEEAAQELRRCAGRQFDPHLVEHFLEAVEAAREEGEGGRRKLPKQTVLEIALQIEHLIDAVDRRDAGELQALAGRLACLAGQAGLEEIAEAAEGLESLASQEDAAWASVLGPLRDLIQLCCATSADLPGPAVPLPALSGAGVEGA